MANRYELFLPAFMLFIFSIGTAHAVNLGMLAEEESVRAEPGSEAVFTVLFWTTDEESFDVSLKVTERPKNWVVSLGADVFALPPENSKRSIYLPERGYVRAFVEEVRMKVPDSAPSGRYAVALSAYAGDSSSSISVLQERVFELDVIVAGTGSVQQSVDENSPDNQGNRSNADNQVAEGPGNKAKTQPSGEDIGPKQKGAGLFFSKRAMLLLASLIIILYISWRLYKRP